MLGISSRVAHGFCDLMTTTSTRVTILGVIIPLLCTWSSFTVLALSTKPSIPDSKFKFKLNPEETTVLLPGQLALFKCSGPGTPDTAVQWLKDDISIGNALGVQRADKKRRRQSQKRTASLWWSRHRSRNTSASDFRKISNTSNSVSTKSSVGDSGYTVLHNGSLRISFVKRSHAGQYKCFVEDSYSKILRRKFSLTVATSPRCTIHSSTNSAYRHGNARFFCSTDSAIDVVYSWSKDGRVLPKNEKFVQLSNGALQIFNLSSEDAGNYSCYVRSALGEDTSDNMELNILPQRTNLLPKINFLVTPQDVHVYPPYDDGAIFECLVDDPNVTYSWIRPKDDGRICPETVCPLIRTLQINNLVLGAGIYEYYNGDYICIVRDRNNVDVRIQKRARLDMYVEPTVELSLTPSKVRLSNSATFSCTTNGNPPPRLYWLKDGVDLKDGGAWNSQVKIQDFATSTDYNSYLTLSAIESTAAGYYQCVAENSVAAASAWINLTIVRSEYVPSPENVTAIAQGESEILVEWDAPDYPGIHSYRILYEAEENLGGDRTVGPTVTRALLTGLHAFTNYAIKVVAYTKLDPSDPSSLVLARTMEGVPCQTLDEDHISLLAVNSTTMLVTWQSLPIKGRCGIVTEYEVNCLYKVTDLFNVKVPTRRSPLDDSDDILVMEYALISGLEPGKEYVIGITPATQVGKGRESGLTFTELPQSPTGNCTENGDLAIESLSGRIDSKSKDLIVEWDLRPGLSAEQISVILLSSDNQLSRRELVGVMARNVSFKSVDLLKAYLVTVNLLHNNEQPCESQKIAVLSEVGTDEEEDAAPFDLVGTSSDRGCIDLSWSFSLDNNDATQFYVVRYNFVKYFPHKKEYKYTNSTEMHARVCGLRPWSDYEFAVAYVAELATPYNNLTFAEMGHYVRTPEEEPGVPPRSYCTPLGPGQARCEWKEPQYPNGEILNYTLEYRTKRNTTWLTVTSDVPNAIVMCLEPEITYYFRVRATNSAGVGKASAHSIFAAPDYNTSLVNCTFEDKTELPPPEDDLTLYLAIGGGVIGLCIVICILLLYTFSRNRHWRLKLYHKEKNRLALYNGTAKNGCLMNGCSVSPTKQNGYLAHNGSVGEFELLEEQRAVLLHKKSDSEPCQNGHVDGCRSTDYKKNDVIKNGCHKGLPSKKLNGIVYSTHDRQSREENGTVKNSFSFDTLLRSKADKNKSMVVPESSKEFLVPDCRLILSVPIPKHASKSCGWAGTMESKGQHCSTSFDSRDENFRPVEPNF